MSVASLITNSSLTLNSAISVSVPDVDVFWYLTPSVINANFPDSPAYSLWDLQFTNWTPTTIANWYYYCPDICDTRAGNVEKTWTPFYDSNDAFAPPSSIPYSWIKMNAVRLQSKGLGGSEDRTIRASYGSFSKNIGIRYQIDSFSTYSYSGLAPYTGFLKVCDSVAMILGPDKALKGLNFPWDSYSKLSPVRPLCVSVGGTPGVTYFAGDFQITPSSDKNVTASAWFKIAADLSLPEGFSLMQFSGSFSNMGDVRNIVSFEASGNFTLITPQINLDHFGGITYAAESLGALGYDKETGNMWYIPSSRTMNSPQMPYRFQMNLPKSCLLIFGSLSQNEVLPAKLGQEMTYLGSWGKKNYTFASFSSTAAAHKLNITIKSDQDSNFVVYENPTSVLEEEGITPVAYYQIGFTGSPILTLAYPNASQYIWAQYGPASTASGYSWFPLTTTVDEGGAIYTEVKGYGVYAVVSKQSISAGKRTFQEFWATIIKYEYTECFSYRYQWFSDNLTIDSKDATAYYINPFEKKEFDALRSENMGMFPDDAGSTGLGLNYQKLNQEIIYDSVYQSHMISQPIDAYTSAPAAFGDHEPHADYSEQDFTNEYGFESYLFDHSYPPMENSSWMERGEYSLGSPRTETNCRSHVNPSSLGSNFPDYGLKSGQTVVKDSKFLTSPSASKIKIKSTSINISAHGKVDRKTLKRMRNRVSASRCRIKKKEWIHDLEDESKALSNQNKMLLEKIASLEESIAAYSAGRG